MIIGLYSPLPRSGKTTVADVLDRYGHERVPFAGTLKRMARQLLYSFGHNPDEVAALELGDKSGEVRGLPGVTLRRIYQTLGTEWGRQTIDKDIWLKAWKIQAEDATKRGRDVVADDVRFPNEAELIRSMGGQVWKIVRPDVKVDAAALHTSEQALEHFIFDRTIVNDGDLTTLRAKVAQALAY